MLLLKPTLTITLILSCLSYQAAAETEVVQSKGSWDEGAAIGILAGLVQPIATGGWNLQLEGRYGRFVFDYSHGWSLDIPVVGDAKAQELALHLPYSTGLGLGYKVSESLDLRFEPKLHRFDVGYDDADTTLVSYRTVTLGAGAYYTYKPFQSRDDASRGITLTANIRYWQNAWSSLDDDAFTYENMRTGKTEVHKASNIGIANTPVIVNLGVGYIYEL